MTYHPIKLQGHQLKTTQREMLPKVLEFVTDDSCSSLLLPFTKLIKTKATCMGDIKQLQ